MTNAATAPKPTTPGVVDDEETKGHENRVGSGRRGRVATTMRTTSDAQAANAGPIAARSAGPTLEPVGDVAENGTRFLPRACVRDRPARDGVEAHEDDGRRDGRDGDRRCPARVGRPTPADEERCVRRQEHEQPTAVGAEAAPATATSATRDCRPGPARSARRRRASSPAGWDVPKTPCSRAERDSATDRVEAEDNR
jgi:hypothetical protein